MAAINFNRNELPEDNGGFEPIPEGWYKVTIKSAELKPTKDGTGQYIKIEYKLDNGRVVFGNLNIKNKSQDAERIGLQQLGSLMGAIGLASVRDTDQLIGGVLEIKLSVKPATAEYPAGNDVKAYRAIEGSQMPTPKAQASVSSASTPPWAKKA